MLFNDLLTFCPFALHRSLGPKFLKTNLGNFYVLIHAADPQLRQVMTTIFTYVVRPSLLFIIKQNNQILTAGK